MHPIGMQQVRPADVLQTKLSLCCCTKQLTISFLLSSTNRRHPWARQSERMSEAWSAETLQVCHVVVAVALVDVVVLATCLS
jgi:hypothetical protein